MVVSLDTHNRLDDKLDKITSMMVNLHGSSQNRPFKPKVYQGKRREQDRNHYNQDRYQGRYRSNHRVGECHIEVELSMDKIIEEGHSMIKITEVNLGEEILEVCKIIEVRT